MDSVIGLNNLMLAIVEATQANDVAKGFSFLIAVIFLLFMYRQYKRPGHDFRSEASTILTSLGVTGTFVGILIALQNFNLNDIDDSISQMLDGLKIAFVTSVLGIASSVFFQIFAPAPRRWGRERGQADEEDVDRTVSDLYQVLKESLEAQRDLAQQIGGDSDSSLTGQVQKMRLSQSDFTKDLFKKLDEFAEQMARGATEQIIEALKNVIVDFNEKLTEQFGDNFKKLNEAVFELVRWQENYKQQLDEMQTAFDTSVTAIEHSKTSIEKIAESSQSIPDAMDRLGPILQAVQRQIADLESHLEAFVLMRDSAVAAIPEIQNHVTTLVDDIAAATSSTTEKVEELAVITESTFAVFAQTATTASTELQRSTEKAAGEVAELAGQIVEKTTAITKAMADGAQDIQTTMDAGQKELVSGFTEMAQTIVDKQHDGAEKLRLSVETNLTTLQTQFSEMLQSITDNQKEAASRLAESIKSGVDGIEVSLEAAGNKITDSATRSVEQLQDRFTAVLESLTSHQSDAQERISAKADEFRQTIQEQLGDVQRELGEAANNLTEQQREISKTLGDTGESIKAAATDTSRQMQESVDQIARKISESLTQAQSAITQTTESVANRMDDVARKHFEAVYQSIEQSGGNMRTLMETQFENFGKGIQESIESIVQELGEGLTRISRELVRDISELRDVTQALKSQREQERNDL